MRKFSDNQIFGIVLIVVGILFTLDNLYYIDLDIADMIFSLPSILFLIGLSSYKNNHRSPKAYSFFGLAVIGWILIMYGYSPFELLIENWPAIIILIGLYILLNDKKINTPRNPGNTETESSGKLDEFIFWRGMKRRYDNSIFSGGDLSILMGGAELDLKNATLEEGKVVLNISVIMGGLELWIPSDWNVIYNGVTLFGGFEDARLKRPSFDIDLNKTLEIKGLILFGGMEIK
ncbi:MAG: hypothetical protein D6830_01625 [Ignavibacteria bacterium]|nr:MAG: hypothetical protein D6830_01625 [Ignavibacteria bacterium]